MSSPIKRRDMDLMKLMMSDYKVEMINDGMQKFSVEFHGPKDKGVMAGAKAAVIIATIANAIPTLASVTMLPWARANRNHTTQALIISAMVGATYFIVADKIVLATATTYSCNPPSNA